MTSHELIDIIQKILRTLQVQVEEQELDLDPGLEEDLEEIQDAEDQ